MYFYRLDSWLSSYLTGRHNCLRSPRWTTVDGVFFPRFPCKFLRLFGQKIPRACHPLAETRRFWKRERLFWQFSGSSPLLAARYHSVFLYSSLGLHHIFWLLFCNESFNCVDMSFNRDPIEIHDPFVEGPGDATTQCHLVEGPILSDRPLWFCRCAESRCQSSVLSQANAARTGCSWPVEPGDEANGNWDSTA